MRHAFFWLLAATTALAGPTPGEEGTPEFERAAALVRQLGHPRFAVREAAGKQLLEMGGSAVIALHAGAKSEDEEVRTRCTALLPQAKAADWRRRAEAYLVDVAGKEKHDLPLLAEWEKLTGNADPDGRKLFAEMIRTNGEFLATAAADRKVAPAECAKRCRALLDQVRSPKGQIKAEVGDLAAVLFVDALAPPKQIDWLARGFPSSLLTNPGLADAIDAKDTGPAVRRLLVRWGESRPQRDQIGWQQFAAFVRKKPFPEAAPVLAKLAKDKTADALGIRALAVEALGKVGGKVATDTLTDLLTDTTQVFQGSQGVEPRLGDAALAALIQMSGKKLSDYALNNNYGIGFGTADGEEPIMLQIHGFRSADDRTKAVQKWKDESAKTADPGKKSK